jgi:BirA family biotin operon repressor/biotin-[acetyl-CoA-carboxylase] ligase
MRFLSKDNEYVFHSILVDVKHYAEVESTQSLLREIYHEKLLHNDKVEFNRVAVVSADHQRAGKGKGDRKWFSAAAFKCLAMSFLFPFPIELTASAPFITQLLALSAVDALKALGVANACVKWPNDIVLEGRKVGGILAEMFPLCSGFHAIIIGIGMNIDVPDDVLDANVGRDRVWPPGAIGQLVGVEIAPEKLREKLIEQFLLNLLEFLREKKPAGFFLSRANEYQILLGSKISFRITDSDTVSAVHSGLSSDGGLLIETEGIEKVYYSGEIVFK